MMEVTPLTVNYFQPGQSNKNATESSENNSQPLDIINKSKDVPTSAPKIGMCNLG